ncbi:MAG: hypothetical protein Q7T57_07440 [Dehalococcoidales bacterium]|nr:hypothetical protein [Dehalococcoidales bacterium]
MKKEAKKPDKVEEKETPDKALAQAQTAAENLPDSTAPDPRSDFLRLMMKYGVSEARAQIIVDHAAEAGPQNVFSDPMELLRSLSKFPMFIGPALRKNILDHWIAINKLPVSEEYERTADKTTGEIATLKETEAKGKKPPEKYSVDPATGVVKVASSTDAALTWDEAQRLAGDIKKSLPKDPDEKEPTFVITEEGGLVLNPKAKGLTAFEMMAYNAVVKSQQRGDPRSAREIVEEEIKHFETMAQLTGHGGKGEGGVADFVSLLKTAKEVFGFGRESEAVLTAIATKLDNLGPGKGDNEEVKALRDEIHGLRTRLEENEKQRMLDTIAAVQKEVVALKSSIAQQESSRAARSEYDIMGQALTALDNRAKESVQILRGLVGRPLPELPADQREGIIKGIEGVLTEDAALDELAKKALYS